MKLNIEVAKASKKESLRPRNHYQKNHNEEYRELVTRVAQKCFSCSEIIFYCMENLRS